MHSDKAVMSAVHHGFFYGAALRPKNKFQMSAWCIPIGVFIVLQSFVSVSLIRERNQKTIERALYHEKANPIPCAGACDVPDTASRNRVRGDLHRRAGLGK
jgi:hypothetical protein